MGKTGQPFRSDPKSIALRKSQREVPKKLVSSNRRIVASGQENLSVLINRRLHKIQDTLQLLGYFP